MTILVNMAFKPVKMNDHGNLIDLKPGQFMTTIRELVKLCDEKGIDRSKVERSLKMFENIGFSRQETRHRKTIITITESSICESIKTDIETRNETKSRQDRDKIETQKKKEKKVKNEEEEHTLFENQKVVGGCEFFSFDNQSFHNTKKSNFQNQDSKSSNSDYSDDRTVELKQTFGEDQVVKLSYSEHQRVMKKMDQREFNFWVRELETEIARKGLEEFNSINKSHGAAILAFKSYRDGKGCGFKVEEQNTIEACINYAKTIEIQYESSFYRLEIFRNRVEFTPIRGNGPVKVINFNDKGFRDQFDKEIFTKGFKKK